MSWDSSPGSAAAIVPTVRATARYAFCELDLSTGAALDVTNGSSRAAHSIPEKGTAVSATDKARDKAQAAKGKVKKGAGKAIDDPYLEGEGKADQVKGNLKQAGEKVKDAFKK
jgi:uncharacterized protein YjbJ (UPF0337 family)